MFLLPIITSTTLNKLELISPDAPECIMGDFNQCILDKSLKGFEQYINCSTQIGKTLDKCHDYVSQFQVLINLFSYNLQAMQTTALSCSLQFILLLSGKLTKVLKTPNNGHQTALTDFRGALKPLTGAVYCLPVQLTSR